MFALFSGNLKLAAINLRESDNFKAAAICNAGGAFDSFVAFCSGINAIITFKDSLTDEQSARLNNYLKSKRGNLRIVGENNSDKQGTNSNSINIPINGKGVSYPKT